MADEDDTHARLAACREKVSPMYLISVEAISITCYLIMATIAVVRYNRRITGMNRYLMISWTLQATFGIVTFLIYYYVL